MPLRSISFEISSINPTNSIYFCRTSKKSTASAGDFFVSRFALIGS
jgi:hypothetical protein